MNDGQEFTFTPEELSRCSQFSHNSQPSRPSLPAPPAFLYEPNASLMKAGCFALLEQRYSARQISAQSHLFVSTVEIPQFPGRAFAIRAVTTMNKHEANVSVRNFPLPADALKKKLKLRDGGTTYIFGTTTEDGRHVLLICEKNDKTKTIRQ